ncbi:MAG: type II toxin-antitoxin system RelE/ParE family toxin [Fibrobacterota bacterium]|nr:type II toxin-antitoxin system RelE/ParE family toxin [Fibrobacterota bacterium]
MDFEELPYFTKKISKLGLALKLDGLKDELVANPQKGGIIQGAAGARKVRMAAEGRGKSGGYRVLYYLRINHNAILFIDLFSKNEKENLTDREKKDLANFIRSMK